MEILTSPAEKLSAALETQTVRLEIASYRSLQAVCSRRDESGNSPSSSR